MAKRLLVVGATGDVGQGIVAAAAAEGWSVVASARDAGKLASLQVALGVPTVTGDLSSEESAAALWTAAAAVHGGLDAVVVSVNARNTLRPILEWDSAGLSEVFADNVLTHFIAAKTFLPRLAADGCYLGIGGGMADFVLPKMGHVSAGQAALRMMYRAIAREAKGGSAVRELTIVSMVNGPSKRDRAEPSWLTDAEVGRHVCAILAAPEAFPGPILRLESRDQVGLPPNSNQRRQ